MQAFGENTIALRLPCFQLSDVLDHTTIEIASGSKLGIDATKKIAGEGFKREWPPLIKMDEAVRKKVDALFGSAS